MAKPKLVSQTVAIETIGAKIRDALWVLNHSRQIGAINEEQHAKLKEAADILCKSYCEVSGITVDVAAERRNERLIG